MFLRFLWCMLLGVWIVPGLIKAGNFIDPDPQFMAQDVLEIQLLGLQAASQDRQSGIEQVWRFAHPENKAVTGPVERFAKLFEQPAYAPLIGFKDYVINERQLAGNQARFVITLRAETGDAYRYIWVFQRSQTEAGMVWMTMAVSAPYRGGAS